MHYMRQHSDSDHSLLISLQLMININIIVLSSQVFSYFLSNLVKFLKIVSIFVYLIVRRIITVFVSITPEIFLSSSIAALISVILGAFMITLISYCPVIS